MNTGLLGAPLKAAVKKLAALLLRVRELSVNVKDAKFGAQGNGVTDDWSAIQAAIDYVYALGGGIVFLPKGTYRVNSGLALKTNVILMGVGQDVTIIQCGATDISTIGVFSGTTNVGLRDLTVNGNRATFTAGTGICFGGTGNVTDLTIFNCKFTNSQTFCVFLDTTSGGWTRGRITECIFEDSGQSFDTFGSGQLTNYIFTGCIWRNTTGQGFASTGSEGPLTLQGCHFEGPMGNGISLEPSSNVTIIACSFKDLDNGAIGIIVTPVAGLAHDPKDIRIIGCHLFNSGTGSAASFTDYGIVLKNTSHSLILGNTIKRMGREGVYIQSLTVTDSANSASYNRVVANAIVDCNQDNAAGPTPVTIDENAGTAEHNEVSGNTLVRIDTTNSHTAYGIREIGNVGFSTFKSNTVTGHITGGILPGSTSQTAIIQHNRGYENPSFASAATLTIPGGVELATVTGTTTITAITATYAGHKITLKFDGAVTVTDGSTLNLAGNFVTVAGDTLTLVCDGTNWWEIARTPSTRRVKRTSDTTTTVTTNVTAGLSFAVKSGVHYRFRFDLVYRSNSTLNGMRVSVTFPAVTQFAATGRGWSNVADGTAAVFEGRISATGDQVVSTGVEAVATDYLATIDGSIIPSADGTLEAFYASEVAASTVTLRQLSSGELTTIL